MTASAELVPDPVSHISISGVHGRAELEHRRAMAEAQVPGANGGGLATLLAGALLGAALVYVLSARTGD